MYYTMNIQLNFTSKNAVANIVADQPLAVMPAELAKKLLKMYANSLTITSNARIIEGHIEELRAYSAVGDLEGAMVASISWLTERELIQNVTNENWDAYKIKESEDTTVSSSLH